ncbi:MAG TPA: DUF721 domain-containing protein [Nitrospiraceae bacterium]|jgi:hypothetical protein
MRGTRPIDSFATVLNGLARRLGLESKLFENRLQREWVALVGEPIASNTWPEQIRFKKLYLRVHNAVWLHQLTFLKPTLIQKLNGITGPNLIADIVLRVGELPEARRQMSSVGSEPPAITPTADVLAEASAHSDVVRDPELRDHLVHLMARSITRSSLKAGQ